MGHARFRRLGRIEFEGRRPPLGLGLGVRSQRGASRRGTLEVLEHHEAGHVAALGGQIVELIDVHVIAGEQGGRGRQTAPLQLPGIDRRGLVRVAKGTKARIMQARQGAEALGPLRRQHIDDPVAHLLAFVRAHPAKQVLQAVEGAQTFGLAAVLQPRPAQAAALAGCDDGRKAVGIGQGQLVPDGRLYRVIGLAGLSLPAAIAARQIDLGEEVAGEGLLAQGAKLLFLGVEFLTGEEGLRPRTGQARALRPRRLAPGLAAHERNKGHEQGQRQTLAYALAQRSVRVLDHALGSPGSELINHSYSGSSRTSRTTVKLAPERDRRFPTRGIARLRTTFDELGSSIFCPSAALKLQVEDT